MASGTPVLARAQWSSHPNFPDQVLLVGSHENFRHLSRLILRELELPEVPRHAARLFRRWMMAMSGHEHYEESKLYPYLIHRWGVSMADLVAGHEALHDRKAEVYAAFDAVIEVADNKGEEGRALKTAYLAFHETLLEHLELEEDTVVPLLLEMEPEEFRRYSMRSIETLLSGD